ncbi:MAG: 3-phosphoshikimate 1-carboxyvinyltransferase [Clostridia bacterium]|nr:3-phosphoshikimate 1-carboxyvinyltransferase [Clostridia bacterium]
MERLISPVRIGGSIAAIPSKSDAHRLLLCAALADAPTAITVGEGELSEDIHATMQCIESLGGKAAREDGVIHVTPIDRTASNESITCDCGESGSTARFLLPIAAALAGDRSITLVGHGRLPQRPFAPLCAALRSGGVSADRDLLPITVSGKLRAGEYKIAGNISSQYITGLLLALPLCDAESRITLTTPLESRGYVDMTQSTLARFGIHTERDETGFTVPARAYCSPGEITAEGDWSNAAFWLCAGAIAASPSAPVTVTGLQQDSMQLDREIIPLLRQFGAAVVQTEDAFSVSHAPLHAIDTTVTHIPDLVPVLSVVAALADGTSYFRDAGRLRLKESDRLASVCAMLQSIGGRAWVEGDTLVVSGRPSLAGGSVDSAGDHRIAMSAAVAALGCRAPITLTGAEAVAKSYPAFWQDYTRLCQTKSSL